MSRKFKEWTGLDPVRFVQASTDPQNIPEQKNQETSSADLYRQIISSQPQKRKKQRKTTTDTVLATTEEISYQCDLCHYTEKISSQENWKEARLKHTISMEHLLATTQAHVASTEDVMVYDATITKNQGYSLLKKQGWKHGEGLGAESQGRKQPIATRLKLDKKGLGHPSAGRLAVTHPYVSDQPPKRPSTEEIIAKNIKEERRRHAIRAFLNRDT